MYACLKGISTNFVHPYSIYFQFVFFQFLPNFSIFSQISGLIAGYLYAQDYFQFIETSLEKAKNYIVSKF